MQNFAVAAHRTGAAEVHHLWWQKDLNEMHPWERDIYDATYKWRITKEMQDWALNADAIVIQMLHGDGVLRDGESAGQYVDRALLLFRALKELLSDKKPNTPLLSEIDDNMLSTPSYNPADPFYKPGAPLRELAIRQFSESDGLIVSTPYLKEIYSEFNSNIWVIPNCIDFKIWNGSGKKARPGIRIGWAGGANHDGDLKLLEPAIKSIVSKHKDVEFVFFHGLPEFLRGLPGVKHLKNWARIDRYPRTMESQDFDIYVSPLVDNAFNRGKSNLRWIEASAMGIPSVCSNVGHFAETVRNGEDGFLAEDGEFEKYLEILINDKTLRKRMGMNARKRVFEDFNVDKVVFDYVKALEECVDLKIDGGSDESRTDQDTRQFIRV